MNCRELKPLVSSRSVAGGSRARDTRGEWKFFCRSAKKDVLCKLVTLFDSDCDDGDCHAIGVQHTNCKSGCELVTRFDSDCDDGVHAVIGKVTEYYRVLQSVTECYRVLQSINLAHLLGPIFGLVFII